MLGMIDEFRPVFEENGIEIDAPDVVQVMSEDELISIMPKYDGWIIGDDPATRQVFESGKAGNLKAAVKWGIGVDNVDFKAADEFGIKIINTPDMFGAEVADTAMSYLVALARSLFWIDRKVRDGGWPKPRGISLKGKTVGLVGYGDIGKNTAKRMLAADLNIILYDPAFNIDENDSIISSEWPNRLDECDFLVFTCSLNEFNRHMLNESALNMCKQGIYVINVARGPLINENDLIAALKSGKVSAAALDVMEDEPLPMESPLREFEYCIFGSHNGSNTVDAVRTASFEAMSILFKFLKVN
jgi:D-3-phosphoglycerate dehydrogenase